MIGPGSVDHCDLAPQNKIKIPSESSSRDTLVLDHLSVVGPIARRVASRLPTAVDLDDIHSAGVLGLMDAAQRFDPSRGVKFGAYATVRINGAIVDYLRSLTWAPRGMHRRAKKLDAARQAVEQRKGGQASVSELAQELNVSVDQCHDLLAELSKLDFLDADELAESISSAHQAASTESLDPLRQLEWKAMVDTVERALERLPERHKLVLWLYYYEELTMKEVGQVLKVNESRVSQLHSKALSTLRREVAQLRQPVRPKG